MEWNRHPPEKQVRSFGRIWLPMFLIGWAVWSAWTHGCVTRTAMLLAGGALASALLSFSAPRVIRLVFVGLSGAVYPVAWLVQNLALAAVYFLLVSPIGWLLRRRGHDPLRLKRPEADCSLWMKPDSAARPEDYFRPF